METSGWVGRGWFRGRVVRIPNNAVSKGSVFNYSQGFRFIWDQIKVVFTITSDTELARATLLRVANEAIGEYLGEAQTSWNAVSYDYRSEKPSIEPGVALAVNAASLEFTVNYEVNYTKRSEMQDRLFTKMVDEVANSSGRLVWNSSGVTVINQTSNPAPLATRPPASRPIAPHPAETR